MIGKMSRACSRADMLCWLDALGFQQGKGPVFSYEYKEVVTVDSQLAAHVIDTLLSLQQAMSASKLRPTW